MDIPSNYYDILARIESNNNPSAKASTSSGSGLFQFLEDTWTSFGGSWGPNSNKAFGGLNPSREEQLQRVQVLTEQNARSLQSAGIAINNATLYAAHFLGVGNARKVLSANENAPITDVVSSSQISANPRVFRNIRTVGDFFNWLKSKTGSTVNAVTQATKDANSAPQLPSPFTVTNDAGGFGIGDLPSVEDILNGFNTGKDIAGEVIEDVKENNPITQGIDFFKNLFSQNNILRVILVVLGLGLIGLAAFALVSSKSISDFIPQGVKQ